jgi:hypothetical protein
MAADFQTFQKKCSKHQSPSGLLIDRLPNPRLEQESETPSSETSFMRHTFVDSGGSSHVIQTGTGVHNDELGKTRKNRNA